VDLDELKPARWRFTAKDDVEAYGDRWWTFDPIALIRLRARELMKIEETIGMPIVVMLRKLVERTTLGQFATMWVSMHMAGHPVVWDEFDPTVFTTEWEAVSDEAPLGSGPDPEPAGNSSPEQPTESATS
jgi:hypothetical protein